MALKITLLSKQALEADIASKRAAVKELAEENRAGSPELAALELAEAFQSQGLFNRYGATLTDAYFKITGVTCTKENIVAKAVIFTNEEARTSDAQELTSVSVELPFAESMDVNPLAYTYTRVKELALFEGAEDV